MPVDMAFRESKLLSTWATTYAGSEEHFVVDFQRSLQRMLQMGAGLGEHPLHLRSYSFST